MKDKTQLDAIAELPVRKYQDTIGTDLAQQILDLCQPKRRSEGIRTSLHDDVADLVTDMWCEDPPDEKDMADKLINKVLDAVLTDAKFMAYDDGELYLGDLISILDKLRDES